MLSQHAVNYKKEEDSHIDNKACCMGAHSL